MKLIFAGSASTAVEPLLELHESEHELVAVLTLPDAPAGRGRKLTPNPVKAKAEELGIMVLTCLPGSTEFAETAAKLLVDGVAVVAYGKLIPEDTLRLVKYGWINLHFSVLPSYRGAAPVQRAIMNGEEFTGVSVFQIEKGLDTGPVFATITERISKTDTTATLFQRLSSVGAKLLVEVFTKLENSEVLAIPQPKSGVSYAEKLTPADAKINWKLPIHVIDRQIRGCNPKPGAWTSLHTAEKLLIITASPMTESDRSIFSAQLEDNAFTSMAPGTLVFNKKLAAVVCQNGELLQLITIKPAGKQMMKAVDWLRGARLESGVILGE